MPERKRFITGWLKGVRIEVPVAPTNEKRLKEVIRKLPPEDQRYTAIFLGRLNLADQLLKLRGRGKIKAGRPLNEKEVPLSLGFHEVQTYQRFFQKYWKGSVVFTENYTRVTQDAEDIVAEVMLSMLRNWKNYELLPEGDKKNILFDRLRKRLSNFARDKKRQGKSTSTESLESLTELLDKTKLWDRKMILRLINEEPLDKEIIENLNIEVAMHNILRAGDEIDLQILFLRLARLQFDQIAYVMQMTVPAVKTRIHTLKKRLSEAKDSLS